jgi:hypothetical protein
MDANLIRTNIQLNSAADSYSLIHTEIILSALLLPRSHLPLKSKHEKISLLHNPIAVLA